MLENLFRAFVAVFFTVGFVSAAYALLQLLTRPRGEKTATLIFLSPGAPEGALSVSRRLAARGLTGGGPVIAVCAPGDERSVRRLRRTFPDAAGLTVCGAEEPAEALRKCGTQNSEPR